MPLSKAEKLLSAAVALSSASDHEGFSAEDLVVKAFELFPEMFSLKGYPHYPNSNAVLTQVMGRSAPLIVRVWVAKTGTKRYRLTPKGLEDYADLPGVESAPASVQLARRKEDALGRLLTSPAYVLFSSGDRESITFHQYCRFYGLTAGDSWQVVRGKLEETHRHLDESRRLGESGQGVRVFSRAGRGGRTDEFSAEDLLRLTALARYLAERFSRQTREWEARAAG